MTPRWWSPAWQLAWCMAGVAVQHHWHQPMLWSIKWVHTSKCHERRWISANLICYIWHPQPQPRFVYQLNCKILKALQWRLNGDTILVVFTKFQLGLRLGFRYRKPPKRFRTFRYLTSLHVTKGSLQLSTL